MNKVNPFTPNSPINRGTFAGRYEEIEAIDKGLYQANNGNPTHILLVGERGIGKTSLLYVSEIFAKGELNWSGGKHNFLVVRLNLNDKIGLVDFAIILAKAIKRQIDIEHPTLTFVKKALEILSRLEVQGLSYKKEKSSISNEEEFIQDFIYSIADTIKSIRDPKSSTESKDGLVILIDEADKASKELNLGSFLKNLSENLVAENANHILFIVSGLPGMRKMLTDSHESSLRLFEEHYLGPLSKEDTKKVIKQGLDDNIEKNSKENIKINDDAQEAIYVFSEGYPHFVQQIGYSVFEENNDDVISIEDFNKSYAKALIQIGSRFYYKPFYQDITAETQRQILRIMAEKWNGWITRGEIKNKFQGKETALTNGLKALRDKAIIISKEGVKGEYRLQWASFALWIKLQGGTDEDYL